MEFVKDGERGPPRRASSGPRRSARSSIAPRDKIFIARTAGDGEFRAGEQFLRMMRAKSLAEWKDAMRIRALVTSNYTYADRAGNIFYLWNTALPLAAARRRAATRRRRCGRCAICGRATSRSKRCRSS